MAAYRQQWQKAVCEVPSPGKLTLKKHNKGSGTGSGLAGFS